LWHALSLAMKQTIDEASAACQNYGVANYRRHPRSLPLSN
jgi:hypothetical protein